LLNFLCGKKVENNLLNEKGKKLKAYISAKTTLCPCGTSCFVVCACYPSAVPGRKNHPTIFRKNKSAPLGGSERSGIVVVVLLYII